MSAFESAKVRVDAYAAASASVFATAWAAIGKAREGGVDYWLEGLEIFRQTKSMSQVSLGGISYFTTNSDKKLWLSNQAKFYIAASAVISPEAAEQTQGKQARRLAGLKQKSCPNKAQTGFISCEYVIILVEPLNKTIRHSGTKCL